MKIRLALMCLPLLMTAALQTPARANCTLPYTLTNGQTADASQVMSNFNALIACMGTPTTGGFVNKFRNGTMDVWQRGTSGAATTTAGPLTQTGADGWYVVPTGANVTWSQVSGRGPTLYSLQVTGASGASDVMVKQRIESSVSAPVSGQTVTVQAEVYNSTGSAITPTLTVKHASSVDNWSSSVTDVSAAALQSVSNGQWKQVAYTFTASASSSNGLEITFDFGNNFGNGSQYIDITELDIRSTPGVATGINNSPPGPELRPIGVELLFNERYFSSSFGNGVTPAAQIGTVYESISSTVGASAVLRTNSFRLPIQMRAAPTITIYNTTNNNNNAYDVIALSDCNSTNTAPFSGQFRVNCIMPSNGNVGDLLEFNWIASAEL